MTQKTILAKQEASPVIAGRLLVFLRRGDDSIQFKIIDSNPLGNSTLYW